MLESIDTVANPIWDNLRKLFTMLEEQKVNYSRYRIASNGDRIEIVILSIIPQWFIVDKDGVYIDGKNTI
jgi:hypothetical protein